MVFKGFAFLFFLQEERTFFERKREKERERESGRGQILEWQEGGVEGRKEKGKEGGKKVRFEVVSFGQMQAA